MSKPIAAYAAAPATNLLEPDIYAAAIVSAEVQMDEHGLPKTDQYGKNRLLLRVRLEDELDSENEPVELTRAVAISYGKNNTSGQYAALATLIAAACGIPCGDKAQLQVECKDLVDKRLRVQTDNVHKETATYTNIVGFFAPKKAAVKAAGKAPEPPLHEDELERDSSDSFDEIPFN